MAMKVNENRKDAYDRITEKLIELMEAGTCVWHKPWNSKNAGGPPTNSVSKKVYRGANYMLLSASPYSCNQWVTFKQAQELGGSVRKGEKSWPVVFWKFLTQKDENGAPVYDSNGKEKKIPMLRHFSVFNLEQCDGIEIPKAKEQKDLDFEPISRCEVVVAGMPNRPAIKHGLGQAFYRPSTDEVVMPEKQEFKGEEEYYSTLFHELVHSTANSKRVGRKLGKGFQSKEYAREELVAEIGAAMLCGECGIEKPILENSAAYLSTWIQRLKNDKRLFVLAASQSEKASNYILDREKAVAVAA